MPPSTRSARSGQAILPQPPRPTSASGPEPLRRKRVQPVPPTNLKRRRILNGLLAFATIVLFVDALVGDKGLVERLRAARQYEQEMEAVNAIRQENAELRDTMRRLKDDPSAIESIAREELGLIRPGELLFIIRDSKPATQ